MVCTAPPRLAASVWLFVIMELFLLYHAHIVVSGTDCNETKVTSGGGGVYEYSRCSNLTVEILSGNVTVVIINSSVFRITAGDQFVGRVDGISSFSTHRVENLHIKAFGARFECSTLQRTTAVVSFPSADLTNVSFEAFNCTFLVSPSAPTLLRFIIPASGTNISVTLQHVAVLGATHGGALFDIMAPGANLTDVHLSLNSSDVRLISELSSATHNDVVFSFFYCECGVRMTRFSVAVAHSHIAVLTGVHVEANCFAYINTKRNASFYEFTLLAFNVTLRLESPSYFAALFAVQNANSAVLSEVIGGSVAIFNATALLASASTKLCTIELPLVNVVVDIRNISLTMDSHGKLQHWLNARNVGLLLTADLFSSTIVMDSVYVTAVVVVGDLEADIASTGFTVRNTLVSLVTSKTTSSSIIFIRRGHLSASTYNRSLLQPSPLFFPPLPLIVEFSTVILAGALWNSRIAVSNASVVSECVVMATSDSLGKLELAVIASHVATAESTNATITVEVSTVFASIAFDSRLASRSNLQTQVVSSVYHAVLIGFYCLELHVQIQQCHVSSSVHHNSAASSSQLYSVVISAGSAATAAFATSLFHHACVVNITACNVTERISDTPEVTSGGSFSAIAGIGKARFSDSAITVHYVLVEASTGRAVLLAYILVKTFESFLLVLAQLLSDPQLAVLNLNSTRSQWVFHKTFVHTVSNPSSSIGNHFVFSSSFEGLDFYYSSVRLTSCTVSGATSVFNLSAVAYNWRQTTVLVDCQNQMMSRNGTFLPMSLQQLGVPELSLRDSNTRDNPPPCFRFVLPAITPTSLLPTEVMQSQLAVVSVASVVTVMSATSGLVDLQALGLAAGMACAPSALRRSAGGARFAVSPLYDAGWLWVAWGNILIAAGVAVLHAAAVCVVRYRTLDAWCQDRWVAAASRLSFPRHSHVAALLTLPGVARCVVPLLAGGADSSGGGAGGGDGAVSPWAVVSGVAALLWVGAVCAAPHATRRRWSRGLGFRRYRVELFYPPLCGSRRLTRLVVPCGWWGPAPLRSMFGSLMGPVTDARRAWGVAPPLHACAVSLWSSLPFPVTTRGCVAQWLGLLALFSAAAVAYGALRPVRVPAANAFACVSSALNALLAVVAVAALATESDAAGVTAAVAFLLFAVTVLRSVHTVYVTVVERKVQARLQHGNGRLRLGSGTNMLCEDLTLTDVIALSSLSQHRRDPSECCPELPAECCNQIETLKCLVTFVCSRRNI